MYEIIKIPPGPQRTSPDNPCTSLESQEQQLLTSSTTRSLPSSSSNTDTSEPIPDVSISLQQPVPVPSIHMMGKSKNFKKKESKKFAAILTLCLTFFRDNLDFSIIKGDLIQREIFSAKHIKKIETPFRSESCLNLLQELTHNKRSYIKNFLEILKTTGYNFLVEKFYSEFRQKYGEVNKEIKLGIFTDHRKKKSLPLRHRLKLLSHRGEIDSFNSIVAYYEQKWEWSLNEVNISSKERKHLADMYFMTLDAQLEHRRVICDRDLVYDELLFNKVKNIGCMTSEPCLSQMMYLARYGSAKRLAGMPFDDSMKKVEEALSRFVFLPPCRETGIVLYIKFNMISSIYEKKPSESERSRLLEVARDAIYHFGREDEKMGEDFRRMVLTKIALVNLGIGVFGNHLKDVCVTEENRRKAGDILNEIGTKYWDQLEDRWKMFYYIAKSKLCELYDDLQKAHKSIVKALKFSSKGKFVGEGVNIKYHYNRLSFQWKIFLFKKYSYSILVCAMLLLYIFYLFFSFNLECLFGDH